VCNEEFSGEKFVRLTNGRDIMRYEYFVFDILAQGAKNEN